MKTLTILCLALLGCNSDSRIRGDEYIISRDNYIKKYGVAFMGESWDVDLMNVIDLVKKFDKERIIRITGNDGKYDVSCERDRDNKWWVSYKLILVDNKPAIIDLNEVHGFHP